MLSLNGGYGVVTNPVIHSPLTFYQPFLAPLLPPQNALALWFDGQDPAGNGVLPANNAAVASWVDKASGLTVSQGTGSRQPTFVSSIINTRPALRFISGSVQFYQRAAVRIFDNVNNYSIFVVFRPNSVAITNGFLEGGNGVNTGIFALGLSSGRIRLLNRSPYAIAGGDDIISANNAMTAGANYFVRFVRNGATGNQTVTSSNGITGNLTPLTQPALPASDMLLTIGTNGASVASAALNGWVGEVLVYTKVLNDYELAQLFNYIRKKWGINP